MTTDSKLLNTFSFGKSFFFPSAKLPAPGACEDTDLPSSITDDESIGFPSPPIPADADIGFPTPPIPADADIGFPTPPIVVDVIFGFPTPPVEVVLFHDELTFPSVPEHVETMNSTTSFAAIGLDRVRTDHQFDTIDGRSNVVVVIDSGAKLNHEIFASGTIVYSRDFYGNDGTGDLDATDFNGHGTHVAGIIAGSDVAAGVPIGVAQGAKLIILKVSSDDPLSGASTQSVNAALQWVSDNKQFYNISAVNMSFGSSNIGATTNHSSHALLQDLKNAGIALVAASGNGYSGTPGVANYAADPAVWAVGATYDRAMGARSYGNWSDLTTAADQITAYTQRADGLIDFFAPGSRVLSGWMDGNFRIADGTSMAAPHVSGVVSLAQDLAYQLSGHTLSVDALRKIMQDTGTSIYDGLSNPTGFESDPLENGARNGAPLPTTNAVYKQIDAAGTLYGILDHFKQGLGLTLDAHGQVQQGTAFYGWVNADTLTGRATNDSMFGNDGNDTLDGGAGDDHLFGGAGADRLDGDSGADWLEGGAENDVFVCGAGTDYLGGGTGFDTADFSARSSALYFDFGRADGAWTTGGATIDGVNFVKFADISSIEAVVGTAFHDQIVGDATDNVFIYTGGVDQFWAQGGQDTVDLSRASFALYYDFSRIDAAWTTGGASVDPSAGFTNLLASATGIECVVGTAWNDQIVGSSLDNTVCYAGGTDVFWAQGGHDTIDFSRAGFALSYNFSRFDAAWTTGGTSLNPGGSWTNLFSVVTDVERVVGTAFNDEIRGGSSADTYVYTGGNDTIMGFDLAGNVDKIAFQGVGLSSWAAVQAAASNTTDGVTIATTAGQLLLAGANLGQLDAGDFLFC